MTMRKEDALAYPWGAHPGDPAGGDRSRRPPLESAAAATNLFAKVPVRLRAKLLGRAHCFHYLHGHTLFEPGERSHYVLLVKRGQVALELWLPSGGCTQLLTLGPGSILSCAALVPPACETLSARALGDVDLLAIQSELVDEICWAEPRLGLEFYRALVEALSIRLTATYRGLAEDAAREPKPMAKAAGSRN
jgi:CRP-like cAMP-binding protein